MAHKTGSLAKQTSTTQSTADYVLLDPSPGFRAFASFMSLGDTTEVYVRQQGSNDWELIRATLAEDGGNDVLERTALLASSTGSFIAWTSGTREIHSDVPAELVADLINSAVTAGFPAKTAALTWAFRTLTGTAGEIAVSNGDGTGGSPVFSLDFTLSAFGKSLIDDANADAAITTLGLGDLALLDAVDTENMVADWIGGLTSVTVQGTDLVPIGDSSDDNKQKRVTAQSIADLAPTPTHAIFLHAESNNTDGGGSTSGAWEKRALNTTQVNDIAGASIASSVVTLAAGTYKFTWWAVAYNTTRFQTRLANTTADPDEFVYGAVVFPGRDSGNGQQAADVSVGGAVLTFSVETDVELQQRVAESTASNGYGVAANFGNSEVYAALAITKLD